MIVFGKVKAQQGTRFPAFIDEFFPSKIKPGSERVQRVDDAVLDAIEDYDVLAVGFSGGKDSLAVVLWAIDACKRAGIDPASKIELWHHAVDGRPGRDEDLFDWPCTLPYCQAVAKALGLPFYLSWREGGIVGEMLKDHEPAGPIAFQSPTGLQVTEPGAVHHRRHFPLPIKELQRRWCSSMFKIEVAKRVFTNDPRFARNVKALVLTGERRQESPNRELYARVVSYGSDAPTKHRYITQVRPVLGWLEERVWDTIRRSGIVPHPCYYLGFARASCMTCIFNEETEWATVRDVAPAHFARIAGLERELGTTVKIPEKKALKAPTVIEMANEGTSTALKSSGVWRRQAMATSWTMPIRVSPADWALPSGAFKGGHGPT